MIARKGVNQGQTYIGQEVIAHGKSRGTVLTFDAYPSSSRQADDTAAANVDTETNLYGINGCVLESYNIGTQTTFLPALATAGWDVSGTATNNLGHEFTLGVTANSRCAFTAQTDQFYAEITFSITDVSGTDLCMFGFRQVEAYDSTHANYLDYAGLNVVSGDIKTFTDKNNGGTPTATDTTQDWADLATKTLGVYVDKDGWVTYSVDGVEITDESLAPKFQFDADIYIPHFHFLQAADLSGAMVVSKLEVGLW